MAILDHSIAFKSWGEIYSPLGSSSSSLKVLMATIQSPVEMISEAVAGIFTSET